MGRKAKTEEEKEVKVVLSLTKKIMIIRNEIKRFNIMKNGANNNIGYSYFELDDFLEIANSLFNKYDVYVEYSGTKELGVLTVINIENEEEKREYTMEKPKIVAIGDYSVKEIGYINTYIKRNLYINLLELTESIYIDRNLSYDETRKIAENNRVEKEKEIKKETPVEKAKKIEEEIEEARKQKKLSMNEINYIKDKYKNYKELIIEMLEEEGKKLENEEKLTLNDLLLVFDFLLDNEIKLVKRSLNK